MVNLLIDIGNTSGKFSYMNKEDFSEIYYWKTRDEKDLFNLIDKTSQDEINIIVLSNVRKVSDSFEDKLKFICKKLIVVDAYMDYPYKKLYDKYKTLGADRIAVLIGADYLFPNKNKIIFDFGTAITIDFLNKNGRYLGGNISLGLHSRVVATHQLTSLLPEIKINDNVRDIGISTDSAIESGIVLGIMFEVKGYIEKYPDYQIIFSGGDAFYFADKMKNTIFVSCNLVLMGLSRIVKSEIEKNK